MDTSKPLLGNLLNKQIRYIVPVFQRHYVWTEEYQWKPLWEDIQNKVKERIDNRAIHPHYTGSIVLKQEIVTTDTLSTYSVIDGQQRLTTFQLFLIAFREVCRKINNDEDLIKAIEKHIFNDKSFGDTNYEEQKYKLIPTKFDIEAFKDIADLKYDDFFKKHLQPILDENGIGRKTYRDIAKKRNKIIGAYLYFYDELTKYFSENDTDANEVIKYMLISLQNDFQFVEIGLSPHDDPQMIFETLNGRGASLTETDLIRNYIFMRAEVKGTELDKIYDSYWNDYDDPKSTYRWHEKMNRGRYQESKLQFFLVDYLTIKLREEIRNDQVFYRYKSFIINHDPFDSLEMELKELHKYSLVFKKLTNPSANTPLEKLAKRLLSMGTTTIFPLLLFIDSADFITSDEKEKIYKILDSYITRRFLCGYTTKNYNNVFLDMLKFFSDKQDIKDENNEDAVKKSIVDDFTAHITSKDKETNLWPNNNQLLDKIRNREIFKEEKGKSKALVNILLEIEYFTRSKKQENMQIDPQNLTIEHVLPQNWYTHWPINARIITKDEFEVSHKAVWAESDPDGIYHQIERRKSLLHTLGNLTLLTNSLNPSVGNASYAVKKPEIIKQSTLLLNAYFQTIDNWDENEIQKRANDLYKKIIKIWVSPSDNE